MIMQSYFKNDQESCWTQSQVAEEAVKSQWGAFEVVHEGGAGMPK